MVCNVCGFFLPPTCDHDSIDVSLRRDPCRTEQRRLVRPKKFRGVGDKSGIQPEIPRETKHIQNTLLSMDQYSWRTSIQWISTSTYVNMNMAGMHTPPHYIVEDNIAIHTSTLKPPLFMIPDNAPKPMNGRVFLLNNQTSFP